MNFGRVAISIMRFCCASPYGFVATQVYCPELLFLKAMKVIVVSDPTRVDIRTFDARLAGSMLIPRCFHTMVGSGYPEKQRVIEAVSFSPMNRLSSTPGANHGVQAEIQKKTK